MSTRYAPCLLTASKNWSNWSKGGNSFWSLLVCPKQNIIQMSADTYYSGKTTICLSLPTMTLHSNLIVCSPDSLRCQALNSNQTVQTISLKLFTFLNQTWLLLVTSFRNKNRKLTPQDIASVCNKCAKNLATFLNLLVSRRWMVSYCSLNISWKGSIYFLSIIQNLWNINNI